MSRIDKSYLDRARKYFAERNLAKLEELGKEALYEIPHDLRTLVDIGIHSRDAGLFEVCDSIFRHIVSTDPKTLYGFYELAISYLLRGKHLEALAAIDGLLALAPADNRARLLSVRLLCGIGATDIARTRLAETKEGAKLSDVLLLEQFSHYIEATPRLKTLYLSNSKHLIPVEQVAKQIHSALADKRGFALIRYGDGEGAFFKTSEEEEDKFSLLYEFARNDRAAVWFNGTIDLKASGFLAQALKIEDTAADCDIAGVPYPGWINHEYDILSITGITSLSNIVRYFAYNRSTGLLCSQQIHVNLQTSGALREILKTVSECGLISCFPQAPTILKAAFALDDVEFYKLPGEKLFIDKIGEAAAAGQHYPPVFESVMQALARPLNGKLFLVSGGILGKFYCAQIKRFGGVALDIGSLVDAWVAANTRPGFSDSMRL